MKTRLSKSKKPSTHIYLRLPQEMHADLAAMATAEGRSLNSLLVEMLSDKTKAYRFARAAAAKDPLAAAYLAANTIEEYANVVRAAVLMRKMRDGEIEVNEETYPGLAALDPGAVKLPVPVETDEPLSEDDRELAATFKKLSPETRKALLVLIGGDDQSPKGGT